MDAWKVVPAPDLYCLSTLYWRVQIYDGGYIQGQPMLIDVVFTIHNGRNYTITLMTKGDRVKPDVEAFGRILGTFRWTTSA